MIHSVGLSIIFIVSLVLVSESEQKEVLNLRPIIGVLTEPDKDVNPFRSFLSGTYVWWLSSAGALVVPIPYDASPDALRRLFDSVNGLLFTGGELSLAASTQYFQTAQTLWQWSIEANQKGDYFPVWGTCQGFQLLSILASEDHSVLLTYAFDSMNLSLPIDLTPEAASSRLLGPNCPPSVLKTLTQQNSTMNLHHDGVSPDTFSQNKNLFQLFKLLSTNLDRNQKPFASTMEGRIYPFYATQWHPERNQFVWGPKEALDKTPEAIHAMQYLSDFFVTETRKNGHHFPSPEDEKSALIFSYIPSYTGDDTDDSYPEELTYFFPV